MCQQRYAQSIRENNWWRYIAILRPSLEFGYLHLGIYHVLRARKQEQRQRVPHRKLPKPQPKDSVNLEDWKISSVSQADRIPAPIAMLTRFIPIVGVGLHIDGVHWRLNSDCIHSLVALIEQMDAEEWGFHLSALSGAPG
jgi:hypothetical protein